MLPLPANLTTNHLGACRIIATAPEQRRDGVYGVLTGFDESWWLT